MMVRSYLSSQMLRQEDCCKVQTSLVYRLRLFKKKKKKLKTKPKKNPASAKALAL